MFSGITLKEKLLLGAGGGLLFLAAIIGVTCLMWNRIAQPTAEEDFPRENDAEIQQGDRAPLERNGKQKNFITVDGVDFYRPRTYVRREVMFSQLCVCSGGGGYPIQPWKGGVPHPMSGGGVPHPALEGGYPEYPSPKIASTCYGYAAGGVPLVFTQEDFLVIEMVIHHTSLRMAFLLFIQKFETFLKVYLVNKKCWESLYFRKSKKEKKKKEKA